MQKAENMKAYGDTESVNLGTGERQRRVAGNGESRLESLGIPGLKPLDPAIVEALEKEAMETLAKEPRRGGLIMPPIPGCDHDWQPACLGGHISVSRCSKCFVLGLLF
jgi:hypothetical protein